MNATHGRLRHASRVLAARLLGRLQGVPLYRLLARKVAVGFQIAEASEDDTRTALTWFNLVGGDPPVGRDPRVTNLVAKRRGKLLGFVQLVPGAPDSREAQSYWLCSLLVKVRYRGMGIGQALSEALVEKARGKQAEEVLLFVSQDNRRAIDLYHKLGFQKHTLASLESSLETTHSRSGPRRILMRKDLEHDG